MIVLWPWHMFWPLKWNICFPTQDLLWFAFAVLDMISYLFAHFKPFDFKEPLQKNWFTFWYCQIPIKRLWLWRFGRPRSSQYLKSNMTFIVRRKTLNILVSISAQIEWSTEWGRGRERIREISRKHFDDSSDTLIPILKH